VKNDRTEPVNAPIEAKDLFAKLAIGEAISILNVQVVPLFLPNGELEADALLLEEALSDGRTVVNEVGEGGIVGQVRVLHRGELPLLVLQGEQILGAKQNRSFNASFIVAPGKEVVLPVSCVEQGRWQRRSEAFSAGATTLAPEVRARKLKRVSASLTLRGSYDADQQGVWSDVREYMAATGTHSLTSSYEDARQKQAKEAETVVSALEPSPGQVGLAVVRNGRVVVLDVFGSSRLFARAFKKCLRGALSDVSLATEAPAAASTSASKLVGEMLATLAKSPSTRTASPADGDTWSGQSDSAAYTAAVWKGAVYHCAAAG
jgi:hypothetical protein